MGFFGTTLTFAVFVMLKSGTLVLFNAAVMLVAFTDTYETMVEFVTVEFKLMTLIAGGGFMSTV